MIPTNVIKAMKTIKNFCIKQLNKDEYCSNCPFKINGDCYFQRCITPDYWDDNKEYFDEV